MAKPDGRVERGQSLKRAISATRWNDLCDAADIVHGRRGGVTAGNKKDARLPCTTAIAKNSTGIDLGLYEPAPVWYWETGYNSSNTAPTFFPVLGPDPSESPSSYPYVECQFVVALEPIRNGSAGLVAVSGICPLGSSNLAGFTMNAASFGVRYASNIGKFIQHSDGVNHVGYGSVVGFGKLKNVDSGIYQNSIRMIFLGNGRFVKYATWGESWDYDETKSFYSGVPFGWQWEVTNYIRDFPTPETGTSYRGVFVGGVFDGTKYFTPEKTVQTRFQYPVYNLVGLVNVSGLSDLVDADINANTNQILWVPH